MFYIGSQIQSKNVILGLLVTEWILILLPSLIFLNFLSINLKNIIKIPKINFFTILSFPFSIGAMISSALVTFSLQEKIIPIPEYLEKLFKEMIMPENVNIFIKIFTFAVSAGICEEFLFRGIFTNLLSKRYKLIPTSLIVGILFGVFHFNIYRLLPTAIVGFILSLFYLLANKNILYVIIAHSFYNAIILNLYKFFESSKISINAIIIVGILCFILSIVLLIRGQKPNEQT